MVQLRQVREELLAKGDSFTRQIAAKQKELDALFAPDTSKGQQVKNLLEQIADLEAQQQYAVYSAARKTKAVLREDQRSRLESMKPEDLNRAVMERLTLGDLAQALQFLPAGL
jgi:cell division protein FtsB